MRLAAGLIVLAAAVVGCDGGSTVSDEQLISIPVAGGDLNAIRGADLCDGPEPTQGPLVLFLHGASFTANTWVETGSHQLLCEAGMPSLSVDLPGFGRTGRFDHDPVKLMSELVEYLGVDIILVSPSMSGGYSLPWLMTSPAAAAGFVPVAPVGIGGWQTPEGFVIPTLGLWGSEDRIVPVPEGERLISSIPAARLVVIDGGGHAVYKTHPVEFHEALLEFVKSVR